MYKVLVTIKFKDRFGDNKGRRKTFLMNEVDFYTVWDKLSKKYKVSAQWLGPNDYVSSGEEITKAYLT